MVYIFGEFQRHIMFCIFFLFYISSISYPALNKLWLEHHLCKATIARNYNMVENFTKDILFQSHDSNIKEAAIFFSQYMMKQSWWSFEHLIPWLESIIHIRVLDPHLNWHILGEWENGKTKLQEQHLRWKQHKLLPRIDFGFRVNWRKNSKHGIRYLS